MATAGKWVFTVARIAENFTLATSLDAMASVQVGIRLERKTMRKVKTAMTIHDQKIDVAALLQMPYLSLDEAALLLRVSPQTIRKWVSVNGRTQRPHNPAFPVPVRRSRLTFRTCDIMRYHEDSASTDTLPSP